MPSPSGLSQQSTSENVGEIRTGESSGESSGSSVVGIPSSDIGAMRERVVTVGLSIVVSNYEMLIR